MGVGLIDISAFCSAVRLTPPDLGTNKAISVSIHFYQFKLFSLVSMTTVSIQASAAGYVDTCTLMRKSLTYEFDYCVAVEMLRQFTLSFCNCELRAFCFH